MADDLSMLTPPRRLRVFLCHDLRDKQEATHSNGRREKGIVLQLTEWLEAQHCVVWRSDKELFGGVAWEPKIFEQAIPTCDLFVICLTKNFVEKIDGERHHEVHAAQRVALNKHPDPDNTFIIPVRIHHVQYPGLKDKQYVNYYKEGDLERLRLTLERKRQQLSGENPGPGALLQETSLPVLGASMSKQRAQTRPLRRKLPVIRGLLLCMALILFPLLLGEGSERNEANNHLHIISIADAEQSSAVKLAGRSPAFVATDIAAQRFDDRDPQLPPYQITIAVQNLRQNADAYLFIDGISLVLDAATPPPSPLSIAYRVTNPMRYPGNYYRAVYLGQKLDQKQSVLLGTVSIAQPTAASIAVPPPASAPKSHVVTQPGGLDYINIAVHSTQPVDLHFHIQIRYYFGMEEKVSTLLLSQPYEVIFSDASNWQQYTLNGSVYIKSP